MADLTYVRTWSGRVYVAFVLDVSSRTIVGGQPGTRMRTDLLLDAPEMALWRRATRRDRAGSITVIAAASTCRSASTIG
ncbi:hypothetical protein AB0M61_28930 [Streptomyces sp. NPDC051642]|uniref:hypothetical protein n=1 Tax=Streptomyces sp. NPDC051642 TaxID=3154646 RepID=UPI00341D3398